ncbi:MAG: DUF4160 domain-containing protein [Desulfofundulus sp.]
MDGRKVWPVWPGLSSLAPYSFVLCSLCSPLLVFGGRDKMKATERKEESRNAMPCICEFLGIKIYMYYYDHDPPHIHLRGRGFSAAISIPDRKLLAGRLPRHLEGPVASWIREERERLMENWRRAQAGEPVLQLNAPKEVRQGWRICHER